MSDNLKNDVQNALPTENNGNKIREPKLKEPQYLMHCLTESRVVKHEPQERTTESKNDD